MALCIYMENSMSDIITLIHPYYENPEMFKKQQIMWSEMPEDLLEKTHFIVVDDCSKDEPIEKHILKDLNINLSCYRVKVKIRWNWLMCRNLAAYLAKDGYLFLSDMDHALPEDSLRKLHDMDKNPNKFYLFHRVDAPDMTPYKAHPNTYFMHKNLYWAIGGYDETYAGHYGTDGMYRKRCIKKAGQALHSECVVVRYPGDLMPDGRTQDFERKENRHPAALKRVLQLKEVLGEQDLIRVIQCPWEKVYASSRMLEMG